MSRAAGPATATLPRVRLTALLTVAIAAFLSIVTAAAPAPNVGERTRVTDISVDIRSTRQVIQGFGTSNRVWSDPHLAKTAKVSVPAQAQAQILTSLYGRLGLTRVRNVLDNGLQASRGAPMGFAGKRADDHIAFVKQAKRFGLRTFFPGPVYLEDWMKADEPGAYVEWAMTMLRRWRARGLEPALYAPLNEPVITRDFPPEWMRAVVVQLGRQLRAEGFKTKLVIPDDENPTDAYRRAVAVLADPTARQYVAALAYHVYRWDRTDMVRMRQLATKHKLPVWMTEYSTGTYKDWRSSFEWAERMHTLLTDGGVNAIDYMWGYFGSWVRSDTMISIDFEDGTYKGHSPTSLYWLTGHYSRYVRPGYARVAATPASGSVLVSAYKGPKRVIVVASNPLDRTESVRISIKGGSVGNSIAAVRSSETEQWRNLSPVRPVGGAFSATLPPKSIVTFVAARG